MTTVSLGYTIFYVHDVGETLTFFEAAFGLKRRFLTEENDYGELDTGVTTLAFVSLELAESNLGEAGGFLHPGGATPAPASITMVTADVAGAMASAVAAGGRSYVKAAEKPWGQIVGYILGPSNILIEVGTPVAGS